MEPHDLTRLQFRSSMRKASADHDLGLWWQIAAGVFIGLLCHSVVTGLYARWELRQISRQIETEARKVTELVEQSTMAQAEPHQTIPSHQPTALRPGERCIGGRRFVRVENGWRQVMESC